MSLWRQPHLCRVLKLLYNVISPSLRPVIDVIEFDPEDDEPLDDESDNEAVIPDPSNFDVSLSPLLAILLSKEAFTLPLGNKCLHQ